MIFVFGDCEIDSDRHELRRGGTPHTVEPQVFDLLLYLIENRERMVSKDDLFEAIWEGRVVSEANLSNRINLARQAVGDSGKKQAFIRTFPRRGFRFVGNIEVREPGNGSSAPAFAADPRASEHPAPSSNKPSIAVLPFNNMSGDPEQEYFSDGITEDIIASLSRVSQLFVTGRHTTFTYKGKAVDLQAVASELGVRYILEGSVRKSGDRVRITVQLIDGETGNQLWADHYDRELADIFAVQDDIRRTVIGALQPELSRSEMERARKKPPDSLDAWDLYQRGQWHIFRGNKTDNEAALQLFSKAMELESEFLHAYVGLTECYWWDALWGRAERDPEDAFSPARKAVEIDPDEGSAHWALGLAHYMNKDHASARAEFKLAILLNPNDAQYYILLAFSQVHAGFAEEALENFRVALTLSPRDPRFGWFHTGMGAAHFYLRHYDECLEWGRRGLQYPIVQWFIRAFIISALGHLDRMEEAAKELADLLEAQPDCTISLVKQRLIITDDEYLDHLVEGLRKAGVPE